MTLRVLNTISGSGFGGVSNISTDGNWLSLPSIISIRINKHALRSRQHSGHYRKVIHGKDETELSSGGDYTLCALFFVFPEICGFRRYQDV